MRIVIGEGIGSFGRIHSVMTRSAHSTRETKIAGLPNLAPHWFKSFSVTPRVTGTRPSRKDRDSLAHNFRHGFAERRPADWQDGLCCCFSHEVGRLTSKKIHTSCPASARASPCEKTNDALVGSSEAQALFIMILSLFRRLAPVHPRPRKPARG